MAAYPELSGRAAVVTGASRGIGAAAARELARHGVSVVLAARSAGETEAVAEAIRADGGRALAVTCDVSRYEEMVAAVDRCRSAFDRLDILVNNAGVIEPIAQLAESDPAAWAHAADINYKGVYHGLRAAIPIMLDQGGGVVINVSSGAATGVLEGWSHYCSAKAAALSLTRCADLEYRSAGIRVMGLSPGTVATDMQIAIKASGVNPVSQLDPSVHISPEVPARAVTWMCTEAAAEYCGTDLSLRDPQARQRIGLD